MLPASSSMPACRNMLQLDRTSTQRGPRLMRGCTVHRTCFCSSVYCKKICYDMFRLLDDGAMMHLLRTLRRWQYTRQPPFFLSAILSPPQFTFVIEVFALPHGINLSDSGIHLSPFTSTFCTLHVGRVVILISSFELLCMHRVTRLCCIVLYPHPHFFFRPPFYTFSRSSFCT